MRQLGEIPDQNRLSSVTETLHIQICGTSARAEKTPDIVEARNIVQGTDLVSPQTNPLARAMHSKANVKQNFFIP